MSTRCHRIITLLLSLLGSACGVTSRLPEGKYLLQTVTIRPDHEAPRSERIEAEELERYVRQTPNKRFAGTDFYVWLYQQAKPEKQNGWNNWKRRLGEEPVLWDVDLTERSAKNLKVYLDTRGFFASEASYTVDTLSRRRRAKVTFHVRQGEAYRIDSMRYDFVDRNLAPELIPDTINTLVREGEIFDLEMLDRERERVAGYLKERGYYNFSVNNLEFEADTLDGNHRVHVKQIIKPYLSGYDAQGQPIMVDNQRYRIGQINLYTDYDPVRLRTDAALRARLDTMRYRGLHVVYDGRRNLRASTLRQAIPLYPGHLYNSALVNRTYTDLMAMGYFRSVRILFDEQPPRDSTVVIVGQAGDTTHVAPHEGLLTCSILCTPTLKQSFKIDLEGSMTSSFYGLKATVGYQNRNIFRGAEALDISFTTGYEFMRARDAAKRRANEFGITAGLTFPRFVVPWRAHRYRSVNLPKTKLEISCNFQDRPYYRRTLSSVGLTYQWSNRRYSTFSLRPIDINVVDVGYLDENFLAGTQNQYLINSYQSQFIAGLTFNYAYNNQRKHLGGNATVLRVNVETAGNLINGLEHLFSSPYKTEQERYYRIFGLRYAQYVRADISLSRKIMLGEKTALAGRLYGGFALAYGNSESVPFDRLFYAGGSNSMRGWAPRTLGPGSVPETTSEFPTQLGDMKLEANLELRFPIWGILQGATFFDAGNIWFMSRDPLQYSDAAVFRAKDFYKQIGFNTGIGLRFDITYAVLRLDWGVQLYNPNRPDGQRWIHGLKWKQTALNFGVGYPF